MDGYVRRIFFSSYSRRMASITVSCICLIFCSPQQGYCDEKNRM